MGDYLRPPGGRPAMTVPTATRLSNMSTISYADQLLGRIGANNSPLVPHLLGRIPKRGPGKSGAASVFEQSPSPVC